MPSAKARKIQELRQARGMSADELSRRLGVDEALVHRWESDQAEIGDDHLRALADAFDVSQDELRHEEDARHHPERDHR